MSALGSSNLDTRLLRFRSKSGGEDAARLVEDLIEAGRAADAKDVAASALKGDPANGELMVADGRARFAAGDLLGAQAGLLKAARALPKDKRPFRWLGEVLLKRGDPGRAAKVLQRAQAIDRSDPAIAKLLERASRLERVASGTEADLPPPPARPAPPSEPEEPVERTVIRADLTEQLRSLTQGDDDEEDAPTSIAGKAYESEPPTAVAGKAYEDPPAPVFSQAFDDEPTNLQQGAPGLGRPPAPRKPRVKKTMAFGSPAERSPAERRVPPPPRRRPAPPVEADDEAEQPTSIERPKPPSAPTSPGAARAPQPPPPRRKLPSAARGAFDADESDIDDALGKLEAPSSKSPAGKPAPWDAVDDPFAPPVKSSRPPARERAPIDPPAGPPPEPAKPAEPAFDPFTAGPAPEPAPPADRGPDPFAATLEDRDAPLPPDGPRVEAEPFEPPPQQGAEDVDEILSMLKREGLFEPPGDASVQWAGRADVKKTQTGGTRIGLWMGIIWGIALACAVGGYFGWQEYIAHRHRQSAELVEQATGEAYDGDHEHLVDAERHLREARDLNVHDNSGPTLLLFVHSQRALEDGAFDAGFLRPTIAFAEQMEGDEIEAYLDMARAVLAAAEGGHENARTRVASALEARPRDPALLYLAGRLEQRLGDEDALEHLQAAVEGEERLLAPRIALAEARFDEGQAEEALTLIDQVLSNESEHLRGRLWRTFMTSDDGEPEAAITSLVALDETVTTHGAPTDRVLYELARARLLRRSGEGEQAREAVDEAMRAGASEPRLLALLATEGRRAGRLGPAETAARNAVTGAPSNHDFRKLLAEIQLSRRNGRNALQTLAELPGEDPDVIEMRAEAALLLGSDEALNAASEGLDGYVEQNAEDASVRVRAMRIRIHTQLGQAREMITEARALLESAPGDPDAALALGEAAIKIFDADTAVESLDQAVSAAPDSVDAHYLLGRARRLAADAEGAETALRRAVELSPDYTDAKVTLASLLLDVGNYEGADELYQQLARAGLSSSGSRNAILGRLGRTQALIGLGRLDDAETQLEGIAEGARETPSGRTTEARLRLAQGRSGDALRVIRSLATAEEGATATVLALYGDALLAARQVGPAGDAYAAALESDSGSPEALIGQIDMAVRSERPSDAMELIERMGRVLEVRIRPPVMHARLQTLRGRAMLLDDEDEDAINALNAAIESGAAPPEAHFFLGEARSGANSPDARASYERYLELAPEGPFAARARRAIR